MTFAPTYLAFHVLFIAPPLAALAWRHVRRCRSQSRSRSNRGTDQGGGGPVPDGGTAPAGSPPTAPAPTAVTTAAGTPGDVGPSRFGLNPRALLAVLAVALVWTVPWDNALVARGVWSYGPDRVAATLWHAPVGEYLFIAIQPVLVALFLAVLPRAWGWPTDTDGTAVADRRVRLAGLALALAIGIAGALALTRPGTFYLGAILAWAAPVLALQWVVGAPALLARKRLVVAAVLVPTLYLSVVDRIAIEYGIWTLSGTWTTGLTVLGLPVEEGLFFLVTCTFVVQGLVLYRWLVESAGFDDRSRAVQSEA